MPRSHIGAALALATHLAGLGLLATGIATAQHASAYALPSTATSAQPLAAGIEVEMYASLVRWRTRPRTLVLAELYRQGTLAADGFSSAGDGGLVQIWLSAPDMRFRGHQYVRPGDRIVLSTAAGVEIDVVVPDLVAEIDVDADRIVGSALPGTEVELIVSDGTGRLAHRGTYAVGVTGELTIDLAPTLDLTHEHHGQIVLATEDKSVYRATFSAFQMDTTYDSGLLNGTATPGTTVELELSRGTEPPLSETVQVVEGRQWQLTGTAAGIQPGDLVTATVGGGVLPRSYGAVAPELSIRYNPQDRTVSGRGPAGTDLRVQITGPGGAANDYPVRTSEGGDYRLDLPLELAVGPGWQLAVELRGQGPFSWRRQTILDQTRIRLHTPYVSGTGKPGSVVQVRLFTRTGEIAATGPAMVKTDGWWETTLRAELGTEVSIEPGDPMEIERVGGDPYFVLVPLLTARVDPDTETVRGIAPSGKDVRVWVRTALAGRVEQEWFVAADAADSYRADLSASADLERGSAGTVSVEGRPGITFVTDWVVAGMDAVVTNRVEITGVGPGGSPVEVRLVDAGGGVVLRERTRVRTSNREGFVGYWTVDMTDPRGLDGEFVPGDVIEATIGDDTARMEVPPLRAAIDHDHDRVAGVTIPDTAVGVSVCNRDGRRVGRETTSDAEGLFSVDVSAETNLVQNSCATVTVAVGRHRFTKGVDGPGLHLDLDTGLLRGVVAADSDVVVSLGPGGPPATPVAAKADADGRFAVTLDVTNGAGESLLVPGREVQVAATSRERQSSVTLTIPELSVTPDSATDVVRGRASPGGTLTIYVETEFPFPAWGNELDGSSTPSISTSGTYAAMFIPRVDLGPGWRADATYTLQDGNIVEMSRHIPIVNLQHGGAYACGFGIPGSRVSAAASNGAGAVMAEAEDTVDRVGRYELVLRDSSGEPVVTTVGMTVNVTIGDVEHAISVPSMDFNIDWAKMAVSGTVSANSPWIASVSVDGCFSLDIQLSSHSIGETSDDGAFSTRLPRTSVNGQRTVPGEALEVAVWNESGQRIYRLERRALARIYVHTSRVGGRASAFEDVSIALDRRAGGRLDRSATADLDGMFDVDFDDVDGPIAVLPGDFVTLATADRAETTRVDELSVDFSALRGLLGLARPSAEIRLDFGLPTGDTAVYRRTSDQDGRFGLLPEDILARSGWSLDDVRSVRATAHTLEMHELLAIVRLGISPPKRVYLPLTLANN